MNPDQQRIAIAEACGWSLDYINHHAMYYVPSKDLHIGDPLNDLNAMAAAESIIIKAGAQTIRLYEDALQKFVANIVFATAAQRAEAFLRTLNLWKP